MSWATPLAAVALSPGLVFAACSDLDQTLAKKGLSPAEVERRLESCRSSNHQVHQACDRQRSCAGLTDPRVAATYARMNDSCVANRRRHSQTFAQPIDQGHALTTAQVQTMAQACHRIASGAR